jgi:hypothetical protein
MSSASDTEPSGTVTLGVPRVRPSARDLDVEEQTDRAGLGLGFDDVEELVEGVAPGCRARGTVGAVVGPPGSLGTHRDDEGGGVLAGRADRAGAVAVEERAVGVASERDLGAIDRRTAADDPGRSPGAPVGDDDARHPSGARVVAGPDEGHRVEGTGELTVLIHHLAVDAASCAGSLADADDSAEAPVALSDALPVPPPPQPARIATVMPSTTLHDAWLLRRPPM